MHFLFGVVAGKGLWNAWAILLFSFPLNPPPSLLLWSQPAVVLRLTRHIFHALTPQTGLFLRQQERLMFERYKLAQTHLIVLLVRFILHQKYWMPFKKAWSFAYSAESWEWLGMHSCQSMCAHAHTLAHRDKDHRQIEQLLFNVTLCTFAVFERSILETNDSKQCMQHIFLFKPNAARALQSVLSD